MAMYGETVLLGAKHPGTKAEVLESPAGWYVGFRDMENGMPYTRESEYFASRALPDLFVSMMRR